MTLKLSAKTPRERIEARLVDISQALTDARSKDVRRALLEMQREQRQALAALDEEEEAASATPLQLTHDARR